MMMIINDFDNKLLYKYNQIIMIMNEYNDNNDNDNDNILSKFGERKIP